MGGDAKPPLSEGRLIQREVCRWVALVALLYAVVVLFDCPCRALLQCGDHAAQFNGAIAVAVGLTAVDRMNKGE